MAELAYARHLKCRPVYRGEGSTPSPATPAKQNFMYHVYILRSLKNPNKSYVGATIKDVKKRVREHNDGLSKYTKVGIPWELVYFENFYCKLCAEKRERFLKSGIEYRFKKLIFNNYQELR